MEFDVNSIFCEDQAIVASTASENSVNVPEYLGRTGRMEFIAINVAETFDNLTSLTVAVQENNGSSWVTLKSLTLAAAQLVAGNWFFVEQPRNNQYTEMRLYFTVAGSAPTQGQLFAGMTPTPDEKYTADLKVDGSSANVYLRP